MFLNLYTVLFFHLYVYTLESENNTNYTHGNYTQLVYRDIFATLSSISFKAIFLSPAVFRQHNTA